MGEDEGGWGNGEEGWRKGRKGWRKMGRMGVGWWRMGRMRTGLFFGRCPRCCFFPDFSIYFHFDRTKATTKEAVHQLSRCNTFTL